MKRKEEDFEVLPVSMRTIALVVCSAVFCIFVFFAMFKLFVNLDAGQVMVIQSPISGNLEWYTTPGVKFQCFGKITKYNKRSQFWFSAAKDQGKNANESKKIRFNDGGHANMSGGISWEISLGEEQLTAIHTKFGSQEALEQQLVRTVVEKAIYMTGPIMSSKESYADRRNELLHLIEDQIQNGVYLTRTIQEKTSDPITGQDKTVSKVELVVDKQGKCTRAEESPLTEFGVKAFNLSLNEIAYDPIVEEQIQQQQKATMSVQLSMAEAKRAEQQALTTKKEGEATAAKAEWEQKTIMAKEVTRAEQEKKVAETKAEQDKKVAETKAEQELKVAQLAAKAAEEKKKAAIAVGEGESKARTLVMEADGALEKKLEAWIEINKAYANAIAQHQGNWVPSVVMGGQGNAKGNGAADLIDLLMVKTAKDLALDAGVSTKKTK